MSDIVTYFFLENVYTGGLKDARTGGVRYVEIFIRSLKKNFFIIRVETQFKNLNILLYIKKTLKLIFDTFLYNEKKYLGQF